MRVVEGHGVVRLRQARPDGHQRVDGEYASAAATGTGGVVRVHDTVAEPRQERRE